MNYYGQIDLMKLVNAQKVDLKNGKKAIVIPIDDNPSIFNGDKGAFINISVNETKENTYGQSHMIKASVSKAQRESLDKESLYRATPIIGNLKESNSFTPRNVILDAPKPSKPAATPAVDDLPDFLTD